MGHWKGEAGREDLLRDIIKRFQFQYPETKINLTFNVDLPGDQTNHKIRVAEQIIEMIESGEIKWDIIYLDISVFEHVTDRLGTSDWVHKHLVDFSTVENFLERHKDFISSNPRYRQMIGGIFSGPFIEGYIQSPWVNTQLAEKIGIRVKERDMTFGDFLDYAKALHNHNKLHGSSIPLIKICSWNRLELFFENFFKSLFPDFASATDMVWNNAKKQALLKTLQAFEEISKYQPVLNTGWENLTMGNFINDFLQKDDGLFITGGTYMYGHFYKIDQKESRKLFPVETPVLGKTNGLIADFTPTFAVMKKSQNRQEAEAFLMAWAEPVVAERWVSSTKSPTGIKGHLSDYAMEPTDVYEKFALDMQQKYNQVPMVSLRTPTYVFGPKCPVTINELREKLAHILEGKLTAQKYYNEIVARLED